MTSESDTSQRSRSLSELDQDAPPRHQVNFDLSTEDYSNLFSLEDFDFLDAFEEMAAEDPNFLDELQVTDVQDLLSFMFPEDSGIDRTDLKINDFDKKSVPKGARKLKPADTNSFVKHKGHLRLLFNDIVFDDGAGNIVIVGRPAKPVKRTIAVDSSDKVARADRLNEESSHKGTGIGFSMFCHLVACLCICYPNRGILEPEDGGDVAIAGLTIEVTGNNYKERRTHCDWVISKYLLLSAILPGFTESRLFKLSHDEDSYRTDSYWNSTIDQEPSPYTPEIRKIYKCLELSTDQQHEALSGQWLSWYSRHVQSSLNKKLRTEAEPLDSTVIKDYMRCFSKESKVPTPFKVLSPVRDTSISLLLKKSVLIDALHYTPNSSTFHVNSVETDPTPLLWMQINHGVSLDDDVGTIHLAKLNHYMKYSTFQYIYIMSELYPKIVGSRGSFFSVYSNVGLAWSRNSKNSLKWVCCYYTFEEPHNQELVGKWSLERQGVHKYYRSPSFYIARNDIHYASTLPYRFLNMHAASAPLIPSKYNRELEEKLAHVFACYMDSTWKTSVLAGSSRFTTCCHMSSTGNLQRLFTKSLFENAKLRFPDFWYLRLVCKYMDSELKVPHTLTPLFRLPSPLMSIEKDLPQGMNWHFRKANHDNDCMVKLVNNHRDEIQTRDKRIQYYKKQRELLEKMLESGLSQSDFDNLMNENVDFPAMNVFMFIALSYLSKSKRESKPLLLPSQKFGLWNMFTDRHSLLAENEVKPGRVRELLHEHCSNLNVKNGAYDLLLKQLDHSKPIITQYGTHPKDSKGSERDISVMDIRCRPFQYFTESLVSLYNNSSDEDMMSDPEKYSKFAKCVIKSLRGKFSFVSSEDRKNFCGGMHPEVMGLGLYLQARHFGSTGLSAASSVLSTNTSRQVIFPTGFTDLGMLQGLDFKWRIRADTKEKVKVPQLTLYMHMMQGIYANTGGAINTTFVDGFSQTLKIITDGRLSTTVFTTSDDVGEILQSRNLIKVDQALNAAFHIKNDLLHLAMMTENKDKPILSNNMAEFNNVVVTKSGMLPQAPIHSVLVCQPLLGASPMADLIDLVSNARSTLFWGDAPDLAESALFGGLQMFRQKWLVNEEDVQFLRNNGLIPRSMKELIQGFFPRGETARKSIWSTFDAEQKEEVVKGNISLTKAMHIFATDQKKKKRAKPLKLDLSLRRSNKLLHSLAVMRSVSSKLNPRHIQPMQLKRRSGAWKETLALLSIESDEDMPESLNPGRVSIHLKRHTRRDQLPTYMGTSAEVDMPSLNKVRVERQLSLTLFAPLSEDEQRLVDMSEKDFEAEEQRLERVSRFKGMSFKAPGGLPITRMFDGRFFRVPMSFNFSVELEARSFAKDKPFSYKGHLVQDFNICLWANDSLNTVGDCKISFGYGRVSEQWLSFFQTKDSPVVAFTLDSDHDGNPEVIGTKRVAGEDIGFFTSIDDSTLGIEQLARPDQADTFSLPGVVGDQTAIMNYGNYTRSQQPRGFDHYQRVYKKRRCILPNFARRRLPEYPWFSEDVIEIKYKEQVILQGNQCATSLKLVPDDTAQPVIKIDLSGNEPKTVPLILSERPRFRGRR